VPQSNARCHFIGRFFQVHDDFGNCFVGQHMVNVVWVIGAKSWEVVLKKTSMYSNKETNPFGDSISLLGISYPLPGEYWGRCDN